MPRPPRFTSASAPELRGVDRTIWVLVDGVPNEVKVKIGLSDGARTEIKSGDLKDGEAVVTDETAGTP